MIPSEDNLGVRMLVDEIELRAAISDLMGADSQPERMRLVSHIRGLSRLIGEYATEYEKAKRKPMAIARELTQTSRVG